MKDTVSIAHTIIQGTSVKDGAGVRLNRIIGSYNLDHLDPFMLLDEFRSDSPKDYIAGFPEHPHRGIETITYMIHGKFRHKDSKGHSGLLTQGSVQWMTAGRGILHSEMPEMDEGLLWGYQLWLSLPASMKMIEPRYQHLTPDMIPRVQADGVDVNVISGSFRGETGPAQTYVPTIYLDVRLGKEALFEYDLPLEGLVNGNNEEMGNMNKKEMIKDKKKEMIKDKKKEMVKDKKKEMVNDKKKEMTNDNKLNTFGYVHSGSVVIDPAGQSLDVFKGEMFILDEKTRIEVKAGSEDAGFLFLSAAPNHEPIARGGPFVMNTQEELRQAFMDWQHGRIQQ